MENFIRKELKPTDVCIVCTEPFSETHQPVALKCHHIFGHECIKKWLRDGRGNTNSCPFCRETIFGRPNRSAFDAESIWQALCEEPTEQHHIFLLELWVGVQNLWRGRLVDNFTTTEILNAVIPALVETAGGERNPFMDCYSLIAASWDSLGRPDSAQGLAVPLVRLARLMSRASSLLEKWLITVPRTSALFWKANACLGLSGQNISWDHVIEAASLTNPRYFPLLHLYTCLISQGIAHNTPREWPTRRHEIMNLVVERCCRRIGCDWEGRPSNEFKESLVMVYQELRRCQLEQKKNSLRGHGWEEHVVRGLWATTTWKGEDQARARRQASTSARHRSPHGWGNDYE